MRRLLIAVAAAAVLTPSVVRAQPEQAPNPYGVPGQAPPPDEPQQPPPDPLPPPTMPPPAVVPSVPPPVVVIEGLPEELRPKPRTKARFSASPRVNIGYTYAVEDHLIGANIALDLMAETPKFAGGGTLQLNLGRTVTGLTFAWLQWGGRFRWAVSSRARLGFGFNVGFVFFERATVRNDPMKAFTFGPELDLAVDLVQFGQNRALFLSANAGFAVMILAFQPVAATLGSGLGIRF